MQISVKTTTGENTKESVLKVNSSKVFSPNELIEKFSDRVSLAMEGMLRQIILSHVPDGVVLDSWARSHCVTISVSDIRNGVKHEVFKDGRQIAKIVYRDGFITSKVSVGSGF